MVVRLAMVIVAPITILFAAFSVVVRLRVFGNWVLRKIFWAKDNII